MRSRERQAIRRGIRRREAIRDWRMMSRMGRRVRRPMAWLGCAIPSLMVLLVVVLAVSRIRF